jgi:glycosyltransferase involved in cell wall biosynthesis
MKYNKFKPILYIGRLVDSKGIDLLIESYHILFNDGILNQLWIVGGNLNEIEKITTGDLHRKIEDLSLNNKIYWWGHLPHNLIPYIILNSSVFCFTSKYEPGGRTVLEAMACRIPVIATPHGFAKEAIKSNYNGILLNNRDPEQWACNIKKVLKDPEFAQLMGDNARKTIIENYTMDIFNKKHLEIYKNYYPNIR